MKFILLLLPALFALSSAARCVFPFKYRGEIFEECTDMNSNYLWCSPSFEYNGISVPCNEDEEKQKYLRDNFNKMLDQLNEHSDALEKYDKANSGNTGERKNCAKCGDELKEMNNLMPKLTAVAGDHERKLAAYSEELDRQTRRAERNLFASKKIQERAMLVTRRRMTRKWYGTSPFCSGSCPGGYRQIRRDSSGDGKKCWTGSKAYCERVYYV